VKVYSPNDMAMMLQIKTATLRKYSALLEKYGYHIERNSQNHRYYQDKDVITIRDVMRGVNSDVTLEQSVKNIVFSPNNVSETNDINSDNQANGSDIEELKTMIHNQSELIKGLTERLDEQQAYFDKRLNERDQLLLEQVDKQQRDKKGFFAKLFNKND